MEPQEKNIKSLSKKENKALRREMKNQERGHAEQKKKTRKVTSTILTVCGVVLLGWLVWWGGTAPKLQDEEIISRTGVHWHAKLAIFVKGVGQDIPKDIGIGATHDPIHTHETDGTIHMEFESVVVKKNDVALSKFFAVWKKSKESFGVLKEMTVNGSSTPFEGYLMKDGDVIEMHYE